MRPSPTPPDRPRRGSFGRWVAVAACVALAAVHIVRAVSVASDYPYLALLGAVAAVAALGCAEELARVDDSISWMFATALAVILLAGYLVVLVFGLPGEHDARDPGDHLRHRRLPRGDRFERPARRQDQASATPSNAAARTPRCASSARNGTGSTSAARPCTPGCVRPPLNAPARRAAATASTAPDATAVRSTTP